MKSAILALLRWPPDMVHVPGSVLIFPVFYLWTPFYVDFIVVVVVEPEVLASSLFLCLMDL